MKFYTTITLFFLLLLSACTLDEIPDFVASTEPEAQFAILSQSNDGKAPSTIVFENTSLNADSYEWDFGDIVSGTDNTSAEESPSHTFQNEGTYTVTLTAKNNTSQEEDIFTLSVTVTERVTFSLNFYDATGTDMVQTIDGNYAIIGTTTGKPFLRLLDEEGNTIAYKIYEHSMGSHRVIETSTGGFAILGATAANFGTSIMLILTDGEGNEVPGSPKLFNHTLSETPKAIIETTDGGFAILGDVWVNGYMETLLLLTDSNGNELPHSGKQFDKGDFDDLGNAIVELDAGGFAFSIHTYDGTIPQTILVLTDVEGEELSFSPKIFNGFHAGTDLISTNDGGLAMCGFINDGSGADIQIILMDANGNQLSNSPKIFGDVSSTELPSTVTQAENGNFAITGSSTVSGGASDVLLAFADINGDAITNPPITFDYGWASDIGNTIVATRDGGFAILAKASFTNGDEAIWIIKTDENGNVSR